MATKKFTTATPPLAPIVVNADSIIEGEVVTMEEMEFHRGWQPVTEPISKDEAESKRVGKRVRAWPQQCWFNARRVVMSLEEYADASYVEGYCVLENGPAIEHGWVILTDGTVIDPTLPTGVVAYFAGLEFRGRDGIRAFLATPRGRKCRKSPFHYAFGWGGGDSPSYSAAMRGAIEYQSAFLHSREVA